MLPYRVSVCGKNELGRFAGEAVTHLLSLEDPGTPKETPRWHAGPHAQLLFHDVGRREAARVGATAPTEAQVRAILEVGARCLQAARERRLHLLVHCYAGSSRSGAAAYALVAQAMGPGREAEALAHVLEIRPVVLPNRLIVRYADAALGRGGALVRATEPLLREVDDLMSELGLDQPSA